MVFTVIQKAMSSPEEVRPSGVQDMGLSEDDDVKVELLWRDRPGRSTIDVLVCNADLPQKPIKVRDF